jgi:LuxR family maltose regulon positive regulatory protein
MAEILLTKITAPKTRTGTLRRERLVDALHRHLEAKLFLVSAPAGYGKTSLLIDFAQDAGLPIAWYRLDEADGDPATFVTYLVSALRLCFPDFGAHTLTTLQGSSSESWETWIMPLVNDMVTGISEYFVVILDDYQRLPETSPVHPLLDRLLEHLPPHAHFVIAGRQLPPLNLVALAARQEVAGLGQADLRFTPEEMRAFLELQNEAAIDQAEAEALVERTEGWIAGLILSALTPLGRLASLPQMAAGRERLYEFLASQVIAQQPPELRRFLQDTSILETMRSDLCSALTGLAGAGEMLRVLEERNLFISRVVNPEDDQPWYRYHQLLRDYLEDQLRRADSARWRELHRRAGSWYAAQGIDEVAVAHFLSAGDTDSAVAVMERTARGLFLAGRTATILSWWDGLSDEALAQAPMLALFVAKVYADRGDHEAALQALARAEANFAAQKHAAGQAQVAVQRAWLAYVAGRYVEAVTQARRALRLARREPNPVTAEALRILGVSSAASGDLVEGEKQLAQALDLYRRLDQAYDVANTLQDLAYIARLRGQIERTMRFQDEALVIRRSLGSPGPLANLLNNIAYDHYVLGEYERALSLYEEALSLARTSGNWRVQGFLQVGQADVYRDLGLYDLASALYERAMDDARRSDDVTLVVYACDGKAMLHRFRGAYANALYWAGQAVQTAQGTSPLVGAQAQATRAITLVEIGESAAGLQELRGVVLGLESQGALHEMARAQFLLARAEFLAGEEEAALHSLTRALDLSRELGYDQFLVVEGRWGLPLLEYAASQGIRPGQVSALAERARRLPEQAQRLLAARLLPQQAVTPSLQVYTFGTPRVVVNGQNVPPEAWGAARARLLFFYLAHAAPLSREEIGLELWPDFSASRLKSNFDATLYRVRRVVGAERIVLQNGRYDVARAGYWSDAAEFEASVHQARQFGPGDPRAVNAWRQAIALYQGDYLAGLDAAWSVGRRETLRLSYLEGLGALGDWAARSGDWRQAQDWYRRALEADEYQEDVHRKLVRVYLAAGERERARTQLQHCLHLLRDELAVEPAAETLALTEAVRLG